MGKIKVLSVARLEERHLEKLRAVSPRLQVEQVVCRDPQDIERHLEGVEVLYTYHAPFDPRRFPALRWVQLSSAGVDHLIGTPLMRSSVLITTTSGIHGIPIAEYVMACMLALTRRLPELMRLQKQHQWPKGRWGEWLSGELRGATLGIVGYGSIGREVARLATAFGMRVLVVKRKPEVTRDQGYRVPGTGDPEGVLPSSFYPPHKLKEMLPLCDFVVLSVPLTPQTEGLIGREELMAMKPSACLINVSRGKVVDEEALAWALREGRIAGAALDVFSQEPLPPESELWELPNVILTPHISAATYRYNDRATDLFAENLRRYLAGEELLNLVDKERGY